MGEKTIQIHSMIRHKPKNLFNRYLNIETMAPTRTRPRALAWTTLVFFTRLVIIQSDKENLFSPITSQIIVNPTHETVYHIGPEESSYAAEDELPFVTDGRFLIESAISFDLSQEPIGAAELEHVSSAILKVFQLSGDLDATSFDLSGADHALHSIQANVGGLAFQGQPPPRGVVARSRWSADKTHCGHFISINNFYLHIILSIPGKFLPCLAIAVI